MYLENIVFDAVDPRSLGRFWQELLGCTQLSDGAQGFETRLAVRGGPTLDLCFQPVPGSPAEHSRLRLVLRGGPVQDVVISTALQQGARRADKRQDPVPGIALADPEGNLFYVLEDSADHGDTGPIAAISLDSADPDRDAQFWARLTGWEGLPQAPRTLRHPSQRGPLLEFVMEPGTKSGQKNRTHLDVRLEPGDDVDALTVEITACGGRELHPDWGSIPWRVYQDPSCNEFCLLPSG